MEEDDFGLSTNDIVSLSDKDLNQLVGLRKLAPYRDAAGNQKKGRRDTVHRLKALKAANNQVRQCNVPNCCVGRYTTESGIEFPTRSRLEYGEEGVITHRVNCWQRLL